MKRVWLAAVALVAWQNPAIAQTAAPDARPTAAQPPTAPSPAPAAAANGARLATGTLVVITLDEAVGSNSRKRGDKFAIELAEPIVIDGRTVAPAGSKGMGEVVYADPSGGGGTPGKLVLAARYIDAGAVRIRLKAFNLSAGGESDFRSLALATAVIGVGVFLINGGEVLYPVGTHASAKIAEDVLFPVDAPAGGPPATTLPPPVTAPVPTAPTPEAPPSSPPQKDATR